MSIKSFKTVVAQETTL